jgi:hypothetical protein
MLSKVEQERFATLKKEIWGSACVEGSHHTYGRGDIWCTAQTRSVLVAKNIVPDVAVDPGGSVSIGAGSPASLDYAHRRTSTTDVYFFRNGSANPIRTSVLLRAQGKAVELWDAVTGERYEATDVRPGPDGRTSVPLSIPAYGSIFVVLSHDPAASLPVYPQAERTEVVRPITPWTVTFQPDRGAPTTSVPFSSLTSWTESKNSGIRYFSGSAVYHATVIPPSHRPGEQIWLHFTDVREIARVRINGHDAGTAWSKPLTLRVDPWLRSGENSLEIEVTNLWPNRIIGDLQPGAHPRYTETNIRSYRSDSPLLPSGLIGNIDWELRR